MDGQRFFVFRKATSNDQTASYVYQCDYDNREDACRRVRELIKEYSLKPSHFVVIWGEQLTVKLNTQTQRKSNELWV